MSLIVFILSFCVTHDPVNALDICKVVEELVKAQKLEDELRFESKLIGTCNAVVYQNEILKDQFDASIGHSDCGNWRLAVFDFEQMFAEDVHRALRIDKITQRKNAVDVTFSIIVFSIKAKTGFSESVLYRKKIKLVRQ